MIRNGVGPRETTSFSLRTECGYATSEERLLATVTQDFANLNDFPFDEHRLVFTVMSSAHDDTEVRMVGDLDEVHGEEPRLTSSDDDQSGRTEPSFAWSSPEWSFAGFDEGQVAVAVPSGPPPPTRIDRVSRWVFPVAYFAAVALSLAGAFSPGAG